METIYVFDMGNVITRPAEFRGIYLEAQSECEYVEFKNEFYHSADSQLVYKGFMCDDLFFDLFIDKTKSKITVPEFRQLYLKYKGSIYGDTLNIITRLKDGNNMICLLSNLKLIDYEYLRNVIDIGLFDKLFLSYEMHCAKPDREIYEEVIQELGTNDFYFFDDSIENIIGASSLGIRAYNVTGDTIKDCFVRKLKK